MKCGTSIDWRLDLGHFPATVAEEIGNALNQLAGRWVRTGKEPHNPRICRHFDQWIVEQQHFVFRLKQ